MTCQFTTLQNVCDGEEHVADLRHANVICIAHLHHCRRRTRVVKITSYGADRRCVRITEDARIRWYYDRVRNYISASRKIDDLLSRILLKNAVYVGCVIRDTVAKNWVADDRLDVNDLIETIVLVCWWLHGEVFPILHQSRRPWVLHQCATLILWICVSRSILDHVSDDTKGMDVS